MLCKEHVIANLDSFTLTFYSCIFPVYNLGRIGKGGEEESGLLLQHFSKAESHYFFLKEKKKRERALYFI